MTRTLSVYLDLLRFLAAIAVFLHHMAGVSSGYEIFGSHGDDAVMVFFVLSGFVIAYITDTKEKTASVYMASRIARLTSVAYPALLLTVLFDAVGKAGNPALYAGWYQDSWPLIRWIASLTFTNQVWALDIRPFGNMPYWSISYEFWYYVFFAILMFGNRRWLWLWAAFVGPCILLLLPVWLAGVYVYRASKTFVATPSTAWLLAVAPLILYPLYTAAGLREILTGFTDGFIPGNPWILHKARFFLHDYALTALLCSHFLGVVVLAKRYQWNNSLIPKVAAYTYSLYLLHFPLIYCLAAVSPWKGWAHDAFLIAGTVVVTWFVGRLCEQRKGDIKALLLSAWNNRIVAARSRT